MSEITRKEDKEKGWFLIEDLSSEELEDKEIIFKAKDLANFFSEFDKWWLQVKDKDVCISHEGISYEPYFYGKIRKVLCHGCGDYPKWYAGWDKNEIITKFEDNKSYLKALKKR